MSKRGFAKAPVYVLDLGAGAILEAIALRLKFRRCVVDSVDRAGEADKESAGDPDMIAVKDMIAR